METATLILTKEEIEQFKLFTKYRDLFAILEKEKAFEIQFGKIILNFAFCELQNVIKEQVVFKKI